MESNNIMSLVAAFIGVAIIIGIGAQILGNSVSDCSAFPDFNSSLSTSEQTGWAGQCEAINTQTQTAFALLVIVLIVIAAVIILSVVKML